MLQIKANLEGSMDDYDRVIATLMAMGYFDIEVEEIADNTSLPHRGGRSKHQNKEAQ